MKFQVSVLALCLMTLSSIASAGECAKPGPGMRLSQGGIFMVHFDLKDKTGGRIARAQEVFSASTFVFEVTDCNNVKLGRIKERMSGSFTNPYGTYQFLDAAGNEIASSTRTETERGKAPSHELVVRDNAGTPLARINGEKVILMSKGAVNNRVFDLLPAILTIRDRMIEREDEEMNRKAMGLADSKIPYQTSNSVWLDGNPVVSEVPLNQPKTVQQAQAAPQAPKAAAPESQPVN